MGNVMSPIDFMNPLQKHMTTEQKMVILLEEIRDILLRAYPEPIQEPIDRGQGLTLKGAQLKTKGRR